jgi:adenylate cyclase
MVSTRERSTHLNPRYWPIAIKLAVALAIAALLPMLIVSYYNLQAGLNITSQSESKKLEQLAFSTGERIDQIVNDTQHTISYLGWSEDVIHLVTAPTEEIHLRVEDRMSRLITANSDIELFMTLDAAGTVLASSKPKYVGRNLNFRDYYKKAIGGQDYVSDIEVGTESNQPGMYFSAPVRSALGRVAGIVVLKLKGAAITTMLEESRMRDPRLITFLIDSDGIIIYHPNKAQALYHSLTPLSDDLKKRLIEEKRFGNDITTIPSFQLTALWDQMANAKQRDHARYLSPISGEREIVGFAPIKKKAWRVAVSESVDVYSLPLKHLFNNALLSVALVGIIFIGLAVLFARTFTQPLKLLTDSANAVENGDLDNAKVEVLTQDEIGRLALTFNNMIDGIKARQRERDIFGRMVSPEVREKLLTGELKLGGEDIRVTVLFSDIRGFSTMSEKMSPHDVVLLLNDYLTEMTSAVQPWGGYVNNFIGDAIVVVFGAPEARSANEWSAICAARDMKMRLEALNDRRKEMGDPPLTSGIGISTGKVIAGQIGSLDRFMYTVIGDAVNVAARLEDLTKQFDGNPILINSLTYAGCKDKHDEVNFIDQGMQQVKGREALVHVFAVYSSDEIAADAALAKIKKVD